MRVNGLIIVGDAPPPSQLWGVVQSSVPGIDVALHRIRSTQSGKTAPAMIRVCLREVIIQLGSYIQPGFLGAYIPTTR